MTVAVYVSNENDASTLIPWGVRFAHADHTDLLIISSKRTKGKVGWEELIATDCTENVLHLSIHEALEKQSREVVVLKQDIAAGIGSTDMNRVVITVKEISSPTPEDAIVEELPKQNISLFLLPTREQTSSNSQQKSGSRYLYDHAPCDTCMLHGAPPEELPLRILIATHGDENIEAELNRARQLVRTYEGSVEVLYVRPNDDVVADQVAHKNLDRMIREVSAPHDIFEKHIALQDSLLDGIKLRNLDEIDLLLIGTRKSKTRRQVLRGLAGEGDRPYATGTMRKGVPITTRVWSRFQSFCRKTVPQLNREQRVGLVDRLQSNSTFDFDFVALISLSTIIAGLGLIQNSAAVVIGAMLVAPLMTPLVGIGFALLQGNEKLIRNAMRSVILGFAVAFGIGVFLGLVVSNSRIYEDGSDVQRVVELADTLRESGSEVDQTYDSLLCELVSLLTDDELKPKAELLGRCKPNFLDLIVALVSGIAGAYATGRPNLIGALPGVAIAAALVPPIATSGVLFAVGEFALSGGALLLFFTNIVAIVLGTTVAFWGIGINSIKREGRDPAKWPRYWFAAFVVISILLAIVFAMNTGSATRTESNSVQTIDADSVFDKTAQVSIADRDRNAVVDVKPILKSSR